MYYEAVWEFVFKHPSLESSEAQTMSVLEDLVLDRLCYDV